jgi:anti-sigma regulatory factor (Ser/Thr protein kinase)/anti-anti-sigma regulatory factor
MNGLYFHFETVETPTRCAKIRFEKSFASPGNAGLHYEALSVLEEFFEQCLSRGYVDFIVDLQNLPYPTSQLIAFLIALTVRARQKQGDLKLINITGTARNNILTFSPLNYLTIEHEAAAEIRTAASASPKSMPGKTSDRPEVRKSDETSKPRVGAEEEPASLVDIVDPPVVKELVEKIEVPTNPDKDKIFHLRVESRASNLYQLCDFVTGHALDAGVDEKEIGKIKIAVYEACLNVIEHAYHSRPDGWIEMWVRYTSEKFMIILQDHGLSFDMKPPKPYDVNEVIDKRRSGGFGMHIITRAMDKVEYHPHAINGNRLIMVKHLS